MRAVVPCLLVVTACAPPAPTGACEIPVGQSVPNEGWAHVKEGAPVEWQSEPPASGPHYPSWTTYEVHDVPVPRGNWLHNVEHGAVVFLFRPGAPATAVDALRAAYDALPDDPACGHKRALLTPDPDLVANVAVVAADAVLQGDALAHDDVLAFAEACRNHAPEDVCANGGFIPGPL